MWLKSESTIKPKEVDDTSSENYVYVTRNVTKEIRDESEVYVYEVMTIPKNEFGLYQELKTVKGENEKLKERNEMLEECLIEMGNIIYA